MKKMNNKGFSLVELIIVIAIMAVLIGVMAPQFLKYVEQSRRSTDISNAQAIATAIQADIADGVITDTQTAFTVADAWLEAFPTAPKIQGDAGPGGSFSCDYDFSTGEVTVYAGSWELYPGTNATTGANAYKTH